MSKQDESLLVITVMPYGATVMEIVDEVVAALERKGIPAKAIAATYKGAVITKEGITQVSVEPIGLVRRVTVGENVVYDSEKKK